MLMMVFYIGLDARERSKYFDSIELTSKSPRAARLRSRRDRCNLLVKNARALGTRALSSRSNLLVKAHGQPVFVRDGTAVIY